MNFNQRRFITESAGSALICKINRNEPEILLGFQVSIFMQCGFCSLKERLVLRAVNFCRDFNKPMMKLKKYVVIDYDTEKRQFKK